MIWGILKSNVLLKILFIDLTSIVFALWPERYTSLNISFSICIDANFNAHTMINHFNCFFQCALQHWREYVGNMELIVGHHGRLRKLGTPWRNCKWWLIRYIVLKEQFNSAHSTKTLPRPHGKKESYGGMALVHYLSKKVTWNLRFLIGSAREDSLRILLALILSPPHAAKAQTPAMVVPVVQNHNRMAMLLSLQSSKKF